jgi:glycogen debranching enzyme
MLDRSLDPSPPAPPRVQFYVPSTVSLAERRPRILKHGDTFGMFDQYGDVVPYEGSPEGVYHCDTRYLSGCQLLINGCRPLLLSSTLQDQTAVFTVELTNPDIRAEDGTLLLPSETIHLVRSKFIWRGSVYERVTVHNFADRTHRLRLALQFVADFADIFEVRGHARAQRGRMGAAIEGDGTVALTYQGLAGQVWRTQVIAEPRPTMLATDQALFELTLPPDGRGSVFATFRCQDDAAMPARSDGFFAALRQARRELRQFRAKSATVTSPNSVFNAVLCRASADLVMLATETPDGPYPYAGIPWFSTAFGRDGLITAAQLLWLAPSVAKGVLRFLARTQATSVRPEADAEPGKILHEMRRGEMALLGEVPFGLYYGSVDSTPLFVMLAGLYLERTGDLATIKEIWPNLRAALDWLDRHGDRDGDGFIEYGSSSEHGLRNQGWKDSQDSVFHADGRLAEGDIALVEVQGYAYAARRAGAALARALGEAALALRLEQQAEALQARFNEVFWLERQSTYALALDGAKAPCAVRSSNAGHALFAGIAPPERAAAIADQLMDQDFHSGWGIRTIARFEARYNPISYHNGSVWPHDNALIALGFARYGLAGHVQRLLGGLFEAAASMDLRRLPELFCGFRRRAGKGPTLYPVACSPQAWASATPAALLQACLGVRFAPAREEISFRHPRLPECLDEVVIRQLKVGDSAFDILLRRHGADISVDVLDRRGDGRVRVDL